MRTLAVLLALSVVASMATAAAATCTLTPACTTASLFPIARALGTAAASPFLSPALNVTGCTVFNVSLATTPCYHVVAGDAGSNANHTIAFDRDVVLDLTGLVFVQTMSSLTFTSPGTITLAAAITRIASPSGALVISAAVAINASTAVGPTTDQGIVEDGAITTARTCLSLHDAAGITVGGATALGSVSLAASTPTPRTGAATLVALQSLLDADVFATRLEAPTGTRVTHTLCATTLAPCWWGNQTVAASAMPRCEDAPDAALITIAGFGGRSRQRVFLSRTVLLEEVVYGPDFNTTTDLPLGRIGDRVAPACDPGGCAPGDTCSGTGCEDTVCGQCYDCREVGCDTCGGCMECSGASACSTARVPYAYTASSVSMAVFSAGGSNATFMFPLTTSLYDTEIVNYINTLGVDGCEKAFLDMDTDARGDLLPCMLGTGTSLSVMPAAVNSSLAVLAVATDSLDGVSLTWTPLAAWPYSARGAQQVGGGNVTSPELVSLRVAAPVIRVGRIVSSTTGTVWIGDGVATNVSGLVTDFSVVPRRGACLIGAGLTGFVVPVGWACSAAPAPCTAWTYTGIAERTLCNRGAKHTFAAALIITGGASVNVSDGPWLSSTARHTYQRGVVIPGALRCAYRVEALASTHDGSAVSHCIPPVNHTSGGVVDIGQYIATGTASAGIARRGTAIAPDVLIDAPGVVWAADADVAFGAWVVRWTGTATTANATASAVTTAAGTCSIFAMDGKAPATLDSTGAGGDYYSPWPSVVVPGAIGYTAAAYGLDAERCGVTFDDNGMAWCRAETCGAASAITGDTPVYVWPGLRVKFATPAVAMVCRLRNLATGAVLDSVDLATATCGGCIIGVSVSAAGRELLEGGTNITLTAVSVVVLCDGAVVSSETTSSIAAAGYTISTPGGTIEATGLAQWASVPSSTLCNSATARVTVTGAFVTRRGSSLAYSFARAFSVAIPAPAATRTSTPNPDTIVVNLDGYVKFDLPPPPTVASIAANAFEKYKLFLVIVAVVVAAVFTAGLCWRVQRLVTGRHDLREVEESTAAGIGVMRKGVSGAGTALQTLTSAGGKAASAAKTAVSASSRAVTATGRGIVQGARAVRLPGRPGVPTPRGASVPEPALRGSAPDGATRARGMPTEPAPRPSAASLDETGRGNGSPGRRGTQGRRSGDETARQRPAPRGKRGPRRGGPRRRGDH